MEGESAAKTFLAGAGIGAAVVGSAWWWHRQDRPVDPRAPVVTGAPATEGGTIEAVAPPPTADDGLGLLGPGSPLPSLTKHSAVYLDWNATTPIFPEVTAAMLPFTAGPCHVHNRTQNA